MARAAWGQGMGFELCARTVGRTHESLLLLLRPVRACHASRGEHDHRGRHRRAGIGRVERLLQELDTPDVDRLALVGEAGGAPDDAVHLRTRIAHRRSCRRGNVQSARNERVRGWQHLRGLVCIAHEGRDAMPIAKKLAHHEPACASRGTCNSDVQRRDGHREAGENERPHRHIVGYLLGSHPPLFNSPE
jgi:hypothetical protein